MHKKSALIFGVIVLLAVTVIVGFLSLEEAHRQPNLKMDAYVSAQKGWQWLSHYQEKLLDPAIPFIVKSINDRYCSSSLEGEHFWEKGWDEFKADPYLRVFERFFADPASYKISSTVLGVLGAPQQHREYNIALPEALYCDLYPVPSDFFEKAFGNLPNASGYDLTHEFWSAALFKENGCSAGAHDVGAILSGAAQRLVQEENTSSFNDLYAERAAFLMRYGFKDLASSEWIETIVKNQDSSGGWGTPTFFGTNFQNPHTTALAIWALTQYTGKCPF